MRVIQIGIDIAVDDSTDIQVIENAIVRGLNIVQVEVMGIQQSDYSWDYDDYIKGNINK